MEEDTPMLTPSDIFKGTKASNSPRLSCEGSAKIKSRKRKQKFFSGISPLKIDKAEGSKINF